MTTEEAGLDFLNHHGILGMKWGTRRGGERSATPVHAESAVSLRSKAKVSTTGGENHPAHPDAIKAATVKQKIKGSGHASVSNQELRDYITRSQLEEQSKMAMQSKGRKFVSRNLEISGQQHVQKGLGRAGARAGAKVFG